MKPSFKGIPTTTFVKINIIFQIVAIKFKNRQITSNDIMSFNIQLKG